MATPYEAGGRAGQKQRTRSALVAAARELVAAGHAPSVEDAAAAAGVSRPTAYRYFPSQLALLSAAHPETAMTSLLPAEVSDDVYERMDAVLDALLRSILDTEAQQRTMLRLSLDPNHTESLPLRQGRAIPWIAEALEPLKDRLSDREIQRLAVAIRSACGIESLVWLTDIAGLSRAEGTASMRWTARAMVQSAINGAPPPTSRATTPRRRAGRARSA